MNDIASPWEMLSKRIAVGNSVELADVIDTLSPSETARTISPLTGEEQLRLLSPEASIKMLQEFFEEHHLFGVPVVDNDRRLAGVVLPNAVEEARNKHKTKTFLRLSGIIGGEEFRTMPLLSRFTHDSRNDP
jgi:Mg/Co/Ni transporter MgtE